MSGLAGSARGLSIQRKSWYKLPPVQCSPQKTRTRWSLVRRREVLVPTWRGWLLFASGLILLTVIVGRELRPFLAVSAPLPGGVLVVEGWGSDITFEQAVAEFHRRPYEKVYVTGGPLEAGSFLSEYKTYAQRGAAILEKLGLSTKEIQAVPAPKVRRDRTYTSAASFALWLRQHGLHPAGVNVFTEDAHARRSRLLFEKALGPRIAVGVLAMPPEDYDPNRWWHSSAGFRTVVSEALAYIYARVFFWPAPQYGVPAETGQISDNARHPLNRHPANTASGSSSRSH